MAKVKIWATVNQEVLTASLSKLRDGKKTGKYHNWSHYVELALMDFLKKRGD